MLNLAELVRKQPVVPYIRTCDYGIRKPWVTRERNLLDYIFLYIQEGVCLLRVDGVDYRAESGSFCLIQPGSIHSLEGITDTITPYAHMDIFYHPDREMSVATRSGQIDVSPYRHLMQPRLDELLGFEVPVLFEPAQPVKFRDRMLAMVECWLRRDPLSQLEAQCLASELVLTVLRDCSRRPAPAETAPISLNWITSYFSFRLSEPLSVAEMAQRAHLSPSRFSAVFRNRFGVSPHRYLLQLRVRHAQELLRTTDLNLAEIASYCGFSDVHHFSKSFRALAGRTPGSYRKDNGEG